MGRPRKLDKHKLNQSNSYQQTDGLFFVAKISNFLAKQLAGRNRALAYRIKAESCSALIASGYASVNGLQGNGILGLDIELGNRRYQLHIPLMHLDSAVRADVENQLKYLQAVAPLREQIEN